MADAFLPRVNFETLQQYVGRRVLLVGEVKGMEGSTASLRTSDDAEVRIQTLPGGTSWSETPFVEVGRKFEWVRAASCQPPPLARRAAAGCERRSWRRWWMPALCARSHTSTFGARP